MDLITTSLLAEFSQEYEIAGLPEDKRFEHLAAHITVRRHFSETFFPSDIVIGAGGDLGIDAIAIIVNGKLVVDLESIEDLMEEGIDYLDVTFVFVQAERSSSFDGAKIGTFSYGVSEFFNVGTKEPRNEDVKDSVSMMSAIYAKSSKFKRGNPQCRLYYVTTGKWVGDASLEARRTRAVSDLKSLELFKDVEFTPIGASDIQSLYSQSKNCLSREFLFQSRQDIPEIPGVKEAYLGFIPAKAFLPIVCNDTGEIIRSIFYDNVRDWQDYNEVNNEMRETLLTSRGRSRFVLMNNGITIIARSMTHTSHRFTIEDFQIVNGCQTSHVLHDQKENVDGTVMVPLRLICTQDEEVIEDIIHATNKQTEIRSEQFFAITKFARELELFFKSFTDPFQRLYYERRSRQYDGLSVEKTRIVVQAKAVRAFSAMFMNEPHSTSRRYKSLSERIGKDMFLEGHKCDPYYTAAFALYRLEYLYRSELDSKYKVARFQILYALRLIANPEPLPALNAHKMESYCKVICEKIWDLDKAKKIFAQAMAAIDAVSAGNLERDNVHTLSFTEKLAKHCLAISRKPKGSKT